MSQQHGLTTMAGRDPDESHRTASPLELLFDLTFVIGYSAASTQLGHGLAAGHVGAAVAAFALATGAITWAWINYSWFASAFDTDDWVFRILTMLQMVGVLVLAIGIPTMFASVEEGEHLAVKVMVLGYVVMRVPMLLQWLRAARAPAYARTAYSYAVALVVAQLGWVWFAFAALPVRSGLLIGLVLWLVEFAGPAIAETHVHATPWHPHHIAERYGLLVIIALGEGLLGTTATLSALVGEQGWTLEVAMLGVAGVATTFGLWWIYFALPCGDLLARHRERSFGWGYGHLAVFGSVVAAGAGLHVAAEYVEHRSELSLVGTVLAVAVPTAIYLTAIYVLYSLLARTFDPFHVLLLAVTAVVLVAAALLAAAGVGLVWCLALLALAPWVTVVGYETVGHRHIQRILAGD